MLPPHELKNKAFGKSMRGYNPVEVDEYIDFLIEKYTELYRENDELERKLKSAVTRLDEIKGDEDSIRSTLIDAKRAANKIKADAEDRAEAIVRSAKASCNAILADFNEKIEIGRDTLAELQRDAFNLKRELYGRYSEHISFIDKLTEGMDESSIPETSELRRKAVDALKENIANAYAVPAEAEEPAADDFAADESVLTESALTVETAVTVLEAEEATQEFEPMDIVTTAADDETLEITREPVSTDKQSLKSSVAELNRQYKQSGEEVINTPDSDLDEEESYLDFVKSVTGKPSESTSKDDDFNLLFSDDKKKKK